MGGRQTLRQISQSDPVFKHVCDEVHKHLHLAVDLILEKALAHLDKPKDHPLPPDPKAPEAAMTHMLDNFGPLARHRIRKSLEDRTGKKEKDRKAYFGALAGVNPARSTPVLQQMHPLLAASLVKPAPLQVDALVKKLEAAFPRPRASAGNPPTRLVLELTKIKCDQKTHEAFEGRDEIELNVFPRREQDFRPGAVLTPPVKFKLGKFTEGEEKPLSQQLASFPLDATTTFPQGFAAGLILSEADLLDPRKSGLVVAAMLAILDGLISLVGSIVVLLAPAIVALPWFGAVVLIAWGLFSSAPLWMRRLLDDDFETVNEFLFVSSLADPLPVNDHESADLIPTDFDLGEGARLRRGRYSMDLEWKFA
jgi:hypothetical protein